MRSCTWPVDENCLDESIDATLRREAIDSAVGVLWALTGRRFGVCTVIARPDIRASFSVCDSTAPWTVPILEAGEWRNVACQARSNRPSSPRATLLPGPVHSVYGVAINGVKLDSEQYVLEGDVLFRLDDEWPAQDLNSPLGSEGTWSVSYGRGTPPPAGAATAVGKLAAEFALSCTNPAKCTLPRRATQATRQGVTVQMSDPAEIIAAGGTGIPEVDMWVRAHNPHKLSQPSSVWSPDVEVR